MNHLENFELATKCVGSRDVRKNLKASLKKMLIEGECSL